MKLTNIPRYALAAGMVASLGACSSDDSVEKQELDGKVPSEKVVEYPSNLLVDGKTILVCEGTSVIISSKNFKSGGHTTVSGEETARCYDGDPSLSKGEREINELLREQLVVNGQALLEYHRETGTFPDLPELGPR